MIRRIAYIFALILVFSIPWENSLTINEIGTLTRLIGVTAAVAWVGSLFETMRFRKLNRIHVILLLFILWNITTLFWSSEIDETITRSKTYVQLGVMMLMFWDLFSSQEASETAMQAYVLGGLISIFGTLQSYFIDREIGARYVAAGFNPNDLSLALVLGIPLAWHLVNIHRTKYGDTTLRLVNLAYIPAALVVLGLTASRGSMIASVPALLYMVISLRRYKLSHRVLLVIAASAFLFVLLPLIPQSNIERLASIKDSIDRLDLGGRAQIWRTSLNVFINHPVLGTGSGVLSTHNIFLSVLAETGLIGLTLFLLAICGILFEGLTMVRRGDWLGMALFCVLLLGGLVHTWEDRKPTWLILSFIIISANLKWKNSYLAVGNSASGIAYFIDEKSG